MYWRVKHSQTDVVLMLAMLVVATALSRISYVQSSPDNDDDQDFQAPSHLAKSDAEEEPADVLEQLRNHERDLERDSRKRNEIEIKAEKYDDKNSAEVESTRATVAAAAVPLPTEETKKRLAIPNEDVDIVDREDHVTQYLADLLVNTDSEITFLQASEVEDERELPE
nr:uncharacterized protein LOC110382633 isoform X2 [Helicoverpa armigera]